MTDQPDWPRKTRELRNHHLDSRIWNLFKFRRGDIIVDTYPKSGTTWMQQIVGQLLSRGVPIAINQVSPWMDTRLNPRRRLATVEAQKHRRVLKSHLPIDALVFSPGARYIYVARDGRDVVWSLHHNHSNASPEHFSALNDFPGRVGPAFPQADPDIQRYFRRWLAEDGYPFWPYWEHIRGWWNVRHLPNVHLVHYADLKADIEGEMRKVAAFLGIAPTPEQWAQIIAHVSFDYMKSHAGAVVPQGTNLMKGGAKAFMNKGEVGRWRDVLTAEDIAAYEQTAIAELGHECAAWLLNGTNAKA